MAGRCVGMLADVTGYPALPPLRERIVGVAGALGSEPSGEFRRLLRALFRAREGGKAIRFSTEAPENWDAVLEEGSFEGLEAPIAFRFAWTFKEPERGRLKARHTIFKEAPKYIVLVTPEDLSEAKQQALQKLGSAKTSVQSWGKSHIERMLWEAPAMLARYYPEIAKVWVPDHSGFDFGDFAKRYRKQVALHYRHHRLLGLPPTTLQQGDLRAQIELNTLFVPLVLKADKQGAEPQALASFLGEAKNTVVLGDPGMGKSMLLSFLALLFSGGASLKGFQPPPNALPLLIPLRDYMHERQKGSVGTWMNFLSLRARSDLQLQDAHPAFFEAALRMGEAVLLIDGLDEVGGEHARGSLAQIIAGLQQLFPECPMWVTSRIYGYTGQATLPEERFRRVRIQQLDDDQVKDFLERWYTIQLPEHPRERSERRASLQEAVFRTPSVRRLAGNPLLLTLMAFIHRATGNLPQDRAELYSQCIEMLLRTWQQAKEGGARNLEPHPCEQLNLRLEEQKDYLAHLALYIQERNQHHRQNDEEARGLIHRDEALNCLARRHFETAQRGRPDITMEEARAAMNDFINYMGDRTGLLLDRGGDKLSFIHLSFQEYLSAWIFCLQPGKGSNPAFFKAHLGQPAWEEVLLLRLYLLAWTPGVGGEQPFDEVIAALFEHLGQHELPQGWLTLTRALREKLRFSAQQWKRILEQALAYWLKEPSFSGEWWRALEEIELFSPSEIQQELRGLLAHRQRRAPGPKALACLHLEGKLFGFDEDMPQRFGTRPDLQTLLPDLMVLMDEPGFGELLAKHGGMEAWLGFFQALEDREGDTLYAMTLAWATGAKPCPVPSPAPLKAAVLWIRDKLGEEGESRRRFAGRNARHEYKVLFEQSGCLQLKAEGLYATALPYSALLRPFKAFARGRRIEDSLFCEALALEHLKDWSGDVDALVQWTRHRLR